MRDAWGVPAGSYWYPLCDKTHASLVALELAQIDETDLQRRMRNFFRDQNIQRLLEIREFDECYMVEAGQDDLIYGDGGEGFWFTRENDWIVYCSHEGTITFGGSIVAILPQEFEPMSDDGTASR